MDRPASYGASHRDLVVMALSLFFWGVGEGMFIYFQPLYLQKWGANPVEIGAILSLAGIAMAVAMAPAGYLADRVGARPVMWSSWVLGTIAAAMMALAGSLPVFAAGLVTYGLTSYVAPPMNSYITSVRGRWSVERALTVVAAMYHLGSVAGPIIGGLVGETLGLQNVYRISAGVFLVSTVIVFQARRPCVEEAKHSPGILSPAGKEPAVAGPASQGSPRRPNLAANPRFMGLLGLIFLTMFALYLPQPLTPSYLQNQLGFSLRAIGELGAAGSLGNALIMLSLGHLTAPAGMLAGQALVGLFALIMWRSNALPLFFAGYFFIGGYRLCRAMALAFARSLVRSTETGFAYGLVETGNAISAIAAPLVAGLLYNRSPQSIYPVSLVAITLMLLVNLFQMKKFHHEIHERHEKNISGKEENCLSE